MNWLLRYRLRDFVTGSVWLPPVLAMVAALVANRLAQSADASWQWGGDAASITGAQGVLTALAASMLTFIVFVFSILLLAVQLASAQLTPRVIAHFYRNEVLKRSVTLFVFVFTFNLAVLARIADSVPRLSVQLAAYGSLVAIGVFLYMIETVGKSLRPVSVLTSIGKVGNEVIEAVYPELLGAGGAVPDAPAEVPSGGSPRIVANVRPGVVLAFHPEGLAALARRANCVIELVPQVGDFVAKGDPLFRLHGGDIDDRVLQREIAIGPERTAGQDPAFSFRIIVDIAAKALSPAINDPTTAVLAIDQIHHLLRSVGRRQLDTGHACDDGGRLRLVYRTPNWDDLVGLAVTEIRHYGKDSIQVARRLRAMLEDLIRVVPEDRAARLREELDLLRSAADRTFPDGEDRARAAQADSMGMGGAP